MPLSAHRVLVQGQTPHPHEQQAIEFIKKVLPDNEPYRLWALVTLAEPSGRRYELDALVLGYHALYLVEIKSDPARVTGSTVDWVFEYADGGRSVKENPLRLADQKARVLASLLDRRLPQGRPWVEPLILLSHPEARLALDGAASANVVTRDTFAEAITHGRFPGANARLLSRPVNKPLAQGTARALQELGLAPSRGGLKLGELVLGGLIEEGPGYQDREAMHERMPGLRRRVRTWLVPQSDTPERRDQLRRAAEREASLLTLLGDHPRMLKVTSYETEGPTGGPCVVFEHLPDALPLDAFLRQNPTLSFTERVRLIEQLGEGLGYCHRKKVLHRGLHPGAVLVRRQPESGELEVRLYNFQLATQEGGTAGTRHLSLAGDPAALYRAPELIEDPTKATTASDIFSLGAIAWHVFIGRPPGADLTGRHELLKPGYLSVVAARDDLAADRQGLAADAGRSLEELMQLATDVNPIQRADDALVWVNLLLDHLTSPHAAAPQGVDPLLARRGDRLHDERLHEDLEVEDVIGTGSTARVLRVRFREGTYALKVPLAPEHDARLRAEAEVLERLRGERIVALEGRVLLAGRTCLLLTDAGMTLAALLAQEGPASLDYASRWGEDLLLALQTLEERGVQHRDLKPANLGVLTGASKKARHLMLFDFSLSSIDPGAITAGTPVYRDPFLVERGRWDEAADRWSAAMTLHELLTGVRPRFASGDVAAVASREEMTLSAERFDASVRARLVAFFRKALARDAGARFGSAEAMRQEWVACFASPAMAAAPAEAPAPEANLSGATLDTSIETLPLSAGAKNALDRSGAFTVRELLLLPDNHLSAMRGVGRKTALEILALRGRLRERLGEPGGTDGEPVFFPGYRGPDGPVAWVQGVPAEPKAALEDAGLGRLAAVAGAPRRRVRRLLQPFPGVEAALRDFLQHVPSDAGALAGPETLEAWLELLLPPRPQRGERFFQTVRQLFGLDAPEQPVPDVKALAARLKVTPQNVYLALGKARERWQARAELPELHQRVGTALESLGGVAPVERVAELLPSLLPHDTGAGPGGARRAQALVRLVGESGRSLQLLRFHDVLWLGASAEHLVVAQRLGAEADGLAAREPLPSSVEVREALEAAVKDSPLARVPMERLVALAAEASRGASRSARLELYPRGMPAERAMALSAGALSNGVSPEDVVRLVAARYPEALPLPGRPELDAPLERLGLVWKPEAGHYVRPGAVAHPSASTHMPPTRQPTTHSSHRPKADPRTLEADEFDARLRLAAEKGSFRVVEVSAPDAEAVAEELGRRLKVSPRSLEAELMAEALALAGELGVEREAIYSADREGPGGAAWPNLRELMQRGAANLAARLRAEQGRLVLTQPGLLARYQLSGFLSELWETSQRDDGPAVFMVLPIQDEAGPAPIYGTSESLSIPTTSAAQRMRVPTSWLSNQHRGGVA